MLASGFFDLKYEPRTNFFKFGAGQISLLAPTPIFLLQIKACIRNYKKIGVGVAIIIKN